MIIFSKDAKKISLYIINFIALKCALFFFLYFFLKKRYNVILLIE